MTPELLSSALARRKPLLARLEAEGTDCYRLFHGISEGRPGLAIDRYGPILLFQTWREPLTGDEMAGFSRLVAEGLGVELAPVWNHRNKERPEPFARFHAPSIPESPVGRELGLRYDVRPRHAGLDPLLFLDFRCGRRRILKETRGRSVLNLFAYTCGVGVAAAAAAASEVWNVDFSASALAIGARNLSLNGLAAHATRFIAEDVLPVVRQLAGLPVARFRGRGGERRERKFARFDPKLFDVVVLDPPLWSKGSFGAVDPVRDYAGLLKPALLATARGGRILATNHAPEVQRSDWLRVLERTGEKCGRPIANVELVAPEEDFPSFDAAPPLKVAWIDV